MFNRGGFCNYLVNYGIQADIVVDESCKLEGVGYSDPEKPVEGGDPWFYSENEPATSTEETARGQIAIGKDIVLDEKTGKVQSGTFTRLTAGIVAENSMLEKDPETGKTIVKEKPAVAEIGEKKYYTINEAFGAAVSGETILLLAGEHDLSAESVLKPLTGKLITLKGEVGADGKPLTKLNWGNGLKYGNTGTGDFTNTDFVFDSLEFFVDHTVAHTTYPTRNYSTYEEAIPHPRSQKYVNCVINGQICSMDDVTFDGCTFTGPTCNEDEYLVWNYKGLTVLKNCTFLGTGSKAPIKQYGIKGSQCDMEVIGCTFATVGSEKGVVTSSNGDNSPNPQGVYNGIVYGLKFDTGIVIPEGGRMVSYETGQWAAKYVTVLNGEKDANGKYVNGTLLTENRDTVEDQRARVKASSSSFMAPGFVFAIDEDGNMFIEPDPITGSGTEADPYVIKDLKGLKAFRDRVNAGNTYAGKFFVLDADIDLNNENWEPIGTEANAVHGIYFDGQNHKIKNLKIAGTDLSKQGLFGVISLTQDEINHGPIPYFVNLTIENVDIDIAVTSESGSDSVGSLFGSLIQNGTVSNVTVTGSVKVKGSKYVGGLAGYGMTQFYNCKVIDTTDDGGIIAGSKGIGGIEGFGADRSVRGGGVFDSEVANFKIYGDVRVGGLMGQANGGNFRFERNTVSNVTFGENAELSYATYNPAIFGTLLGCDHAVAIPSSVLDCTVGENVVAPEGVTKVGKDANGAPLADNLKTIIGTNAQIDYLDGHSLKISGGTFEQLPTGWLAEGCLMDVDPVTGFITVVGALTPDDQGVYHITKLQDLNVFRLMVNGGNDFSGETVVLDNDITFAGEWNSGIGDGDHKFMGMFDGQGYKITGLKISAADKDTIGLFGFVDESGAEVWNAWVKNLVLDGAQIVGKENVGGIVGYVHRGIIENCTITNSTISGTVKVGSVAGMMYPGRCIGNTIVATTVSGTSHIGGVAGQMVGGSVSGNVLGGDDAASKVTVTATAKKDECGAGGLVGAVSCSDGGKNYVNDNTIKCAEAITDGVTAPIPFCDFRKNLFSKDESKVEIKRNTWPTVDPNADYYDMVDFASTSEPKDYLRVYNFHPVAEIAGKGLEYRYEKMWDAVLAAVALPSTKEEPVVVQLYPGVVQTGGITGDSITFAHVVVQGAADGTSTLKDCEIQFQADANMVEDLTFKNIVWDNSRITFSTNSKLKDIAFIGNTFKNLGPCASGEARGAVHMNVPGGTCMNMVYEDNVFDTSVGGSFAAINTKNVTGNITIRNNVFKNSCWRSIQLMFNSNDGIDDNITITDNWIVGNAANIQIVASGTTAGDTVGFNISYNVFDETDDSMYLYNTNPSKTVLAMDHNYWSMNPDSNSNRFYGNDGWCKAGNILDMGVYPYYNAYHKDELAAGTMTVRDSLYNLVDPAAIVVNEGGKFVKMTIADAMAASKPGESVMLIRDATGEEVVIAGDVTFDKNGKDCGEIKAAEGYLLVDLGNGKYIAKTPVAEIDGGQQYDTLEKAIAAVAEGQTIKMLANVALTKELSIGEDKSFTLDLNGKKIENAATGFEFTRTKTALWDGVPLRFTIVVEGDVTICDSSDGQTGQIIVSNYGYGTTKALLVIKNGSVTLKGGKVYGEYAGCYLVGDTSLAQGETPVVPTLIVNGGELAGKSYGVAIKGATAELEVNGGKVTAPDITAISTNGTQDWYNGGNCKITINGGLVESENGAAMYNPAESVVKITGGTLKGESAVIVKGGKVEISGDAELIAYGDKHTPEESVAGTVDDIGDALYIEDTYENHKPIVSVIGGMLKSANGHAVQYWTNKDASAADLGGLSIAGGTLVAAKDEAAVLVGSSVGPVKFIEAQVDEGGVETGYPLFNSRIIPQYIAEGYVEKDNGNGTWTVTKGQAEIEVVIKPVEPTTKMAEGMTEEEKTEGKKQAEQIKENIVAALSDPSISDIVGTGIIEATRDTDGKLRDYVVNALKDAAQTQQIRDQITRDTTVESHVEITFESLEVKVAIDESEQHVVKSTLNKVKYEIKPILTTYIMVGDVTTKVQTRIPSDQILANPIEFALSLEPSFVSEMAKVTHLKADDATVIDTKTYPVKRDGEKAYIQLAWKQFSFADIEGQTVEQQVCTVNGDMYDSVATAAATADDGAVITLLKDIPSDVAPVQLKPLQVIELNGKSFDAPLTGVAEGYELAKTPEDQAFIAPKKIEVPTSPEAGAPKIKVRIAGMTADQLKEIQSSGRPRWADIVMGTDQKLIPMVPRSPIGIGTVTIRTTLPDSTFVRTAATARDGVSVKYQLKKRVGNGDFLEYGEAKDIPVFTVDAAALEARTSWKIETIFDEEY